MIFKSKFYVKSSPVMMNSLKKNKPEPRAGFYSVISEVQASCSS